MVILYGALIRTGDQRMKFVKNAVIIAALIAMRQTFRDVLALIGVGVIMRSWKN